MRTRIREIRKAKKLTLAEVAARIRPQPTSAQTIGRLETGRRRVSVDWLNKLAAALEVDAADLVTLPDKADCPLVAILDEENLAPPRISEMIDLRLMAGDPVAMRVDTSIGQFQSGDLVIFDRVESDALQTLLGEDVLLEQHSGELLFGRLISESDSSLTLSARAPRQTIYRKLQPLWAARATMLLRNLV